MARDNEQARIFTKKNSDGETLTRRVTTPQGEVEAMFDGFTENKATSNKPAGGAGAGSTNSGAGK